MEDLAAHLPPAVRFEKKLAIPPGRSEYEILDYFKGCETSSLQLAQQELADGNYSWEQLKLMRIKFLNTYGM